MCSKNRKRDRLGLPLAGESRPVSSGNTSPLLPLADGVGRDTGDLGRLPDTPNRCDNLTSVHGRGIYDNASYSASQKSGQFGISDFSGAYVVSAPMPKRVVPDGDASDLAEIGKRLRWLRRRAKLSQTKAAALFNREQSGWSKFENGERQPDSALVTAIAARFKVTTDFILVGNIDGIHPDLINDLATQNHDLRLRTSGKDWNRGTGQP